MSASIIGMEGKLHAWRIEDREYARQEERRGRRHAFETLEPARTALVVVDMVRDQDHNATLHTIYRSFGDVRPAAEVIGMIESAAPRHS